MHIPGIYLQIAAAMGGLPVPRPQEPVDSSMDCITHMVLSMGGDMECASRLAVAADRYPRSVIRSFLYSLSTWNT